AAFVRRAAASPAAPAAPAAAASAGAALFGAMAAAGQQAAAASAVPGGAGAAAGAPAEGLWAVAACLGAGGVLFAFGATGAAARAAAGARALLRHRTCGVPLWAFFGANLVLTVVGYQVDHLDGPAGAGATAFFIDNKARMTIPSGFGDQAAFALKIGLLLFSLCIEYSILFSPPASREEAEKAERRGSLREWACMLCGAVFVGRVVVEMVFFWNRQIPWVEVFAEAGGVIPLSLASMAYGAAARRGKPTAASELLALPVFFIGAYLNFAPEYDRFVWKGDPTNRGHLYTEGWFGICRHPNYFGEVLSFVGFALASSAWWNIWVPAVMGVGLAFFSVPELDTYLSQRYAVEWAAYAERVTCQMVPFVW
ncbi:unnamed protein product, partial [Prorocentrum cordatum]